MREGSRSRKAVVGGRAHGKLPASHYGREGGRTSADMLADRRGSAKAGFAVGHYEVCEFFIRVEFDS